MSKALFLIFTLPCLLLVSDSSIINVISATTEGIVVTINLQDEFFDRVDYEIKRKDQPGYDAIPHLYGSRHSPYFFEDYNGTPLSAGIYRILATIYSNSVQISTYEVEITIDDPVSLDNSYIIITPPLVRVGEEITITLDAMIDSKPKNTGGDVIFVSITNACKKDEDFLCYSDTIYSKDLLNKPKAMKMEDKHDGTYVAKYTMPEEPGVIIMSFYRMKNGMIRRECYNSDINDPYKVGSHIKTEFDPSLGGMDSTITCRGGTNDVLNRWIGKILVPITKPVEISLACGTRCNLLIDDEFLEKPSSGSSEVVQKNFEANRMYDIRIEYWEPHNSNPFPFKLVWDYMMPSSSITAEYIWYSNEIKSYNIPIKCQPHFYESSDGSCKSKLFL